MVVSSYRRPYPKDALRDDLSLERDDFCFVVIPFAREFDAVYKSIKEGCKAAGYKVGRADDPGQSSTPLMARILHGIRLASFVIVDVTGGNSNVFYELGICYTIKDVDQVLILAQSLPADLRVDICHLGHERYEVSSSGLKHLAKSVRTWLVRSRQRRAQELKVLQRWR
ncbi:MAG: hypothetical protein HY719_11675 [Planctomycetes bacterium]|nr:hypothetical protein [Planctomycetota bacterium]